jgi:hypothetical protein
VCGKLNHITAITVLFGNVAPAKTKYHIFQNHRRKTTMPTVREMLEHLFTSEEDSCTDDGDVISKKKLPGKKIPQIKTPLNNRGVSKRRDRESSTSLAGKEPAVCKHVAKRCKRVAKPPVATIETKEPSSDGGSVLSYRPFAQKPDLRSGDVSDVGSDEVSMSSSNEYGTVQGSVGTPTKLPDCTKRCHESDLSSGSDEVSFASSSDSGGTSKRGGQEEKKRGPWKTPEPILIVQDDMDPTEGAIAALVESAKSSNGDLNATFDEGRVECLAGQVIMEDDVDGNTRCKMSWAEYYPILQVKRIIWHSSLAKENTMRVPRMVFVVSDGVGEMPMVASTRKHSLLVNFWDKKGPYECGTLRHGKIFKLIDYHTGLKMDPESGKMVACIFVEKVRPQPKRNMKKFRTVRALVKERIFE